MVALANALLVLTDGRDDRVYLPSERRIDPLQCIHDLAEVHGTDHEQVDVALAGRPTRRQGPEDEGERDAVAQRLERIPKHVHQPGCLEHQTLEFREDRGLPVGAVKNLVATRAASENPGVLEGLQLPLHGARRGLRPAGDLAHVILLLRMTEQEPEDPAASLAEQDGGSGCGRSLV